MHHTFQERNAESSPDPPGLLVLDLSPYGHLLENLKADAERSIRTPEQQAIYYLKNAIGRESQMKEEY